MNESSCAQFFRQSNGTAPPSVQLNLFLNKALLILLLVIKYFTFKYRDCKKFESKECNNKLHVSLKNFDVNNSNLIKLNPYFDGVG